MDLIKPLFRALPLALVGSLVATLAHADVQPVTPEHCALMTANGVIGDDNPVGCERLRVVSFKHRDFAGNVGDGSVVVLDAVAKHVQRIFDGLHERRFALHSAKLIEVYGGDDNASMADNNSSAFNGRKITGGSNWSIHAYGAAIDINPLQNPFISIAADGHATIAPVAAARSSVNRLDHRPDKPLLMGKAEEVVGLFADNGFVHWGGYWNFPIDYQHFEIGTGAFTRRLASATPEEAEALFDDYVQRYRQCMASHSTQPEPIARKLCAERVMNQPPQKKAG